MCILQNLAEKLDYHWRISGYAKVLFIGLISRTLVFFVAIASDSLIGVNPEIPPEGLLNLGIPIVNLFGGWDGGWYARIALNGYPSIANPLSPNWAWFPLYPISLRVLGQPFFGILSSLQAVFLAGFLLSNFLFFVNLVLFFKLSELVLGNKKLGILASVFFIFWPGSLFYSCVYSESLFMTFVLGAFYLLEKESTVKSTVLGFLAGLTRSSGFIVGIPFFYQAFKKRSFRLLIQSIIMFIPYLLFSLFGYLSTGLFPVREIASRTYWATPNFFLIQILEMDITYGVLFFVEYCLVLLPFFFVLFSKKLLVSVFSLNLDGNGADAMKYFGFSFVQLVILLSYSLVANVHRYAIPILPIYWIYAKIFKAKPNFGMSLLGLMTILLLVGTLLFSTLRWYW